MKRLKKSSKKTTFKILNPLGFIILRDGFQFFKKQKIIEYYKEKYPRYILNKWFNDDNKKIVKNTSEIGL